jgi:hypothetical protein
MTGADLVLPMGGMMHSSELPGPIIQPPAAEPMWISRPARPSASPSACTGRPRPDGAGYDRFICLSLWRVLPPQDIPLALCQGGCVRDDEGTANTRVNLDRIPTGDALFADIPGEKDMTAATIFRYSPITAGGIFPT